MQKLNRSQTLISSSSYESLLTVDPNYPRNAFAGTLPQLWLDATDLSTIWHTGGLVDQWRDKSDQGNHATASGGGRPTFSTARNINGNTCIEFDGSSDVMASSLSASTTDQTTFFVLIEDSLVSFQDVISGNNSGAREIQISNTAQIVSAVSGVGIIQTSSAVTSAPFVVAVRTQYTGTWASRITKTAIQTGTIQATSNSGIAVATLTGGRTTQIGATNNGAGNIQFFDGLLGEVIVYHSVLTATDMDAMTTFLVNKWKQQYNRWKQ